MRLLKGLRDLGFETVIPSPHTIADTHPNTKESISKAFDELSDYLSEYHVSPLHGFATEYMLDDIFLSNLKNKKNLICISKNVVLVELSYAQKPDHLEDYSFQLQIENYIPVLAHPERYGYYHKNPESHYDYLKDLGFDFQLNLLSLTPYYGKEVQKIAHWLLDKGYYNFACTDLHHEKHLQALQDFFTAESLRELMKKYRLQNDTLLD